MTLEDQLFMSLELLLAAFLSMVLGLDREGRNQPAGLRTHMLVGFGACLFTSLSVHAFPDSESARVAAQVITGVGFLGAGTILQMRQGEQTNVKHLTTAASIWATAAIGMAVGAGAWFVAMNGTIIAWAILALVRRVETGK
jgi:putative Mg2+ transporter-C (MgtC) family protein